MIGDQPVGTIQGVCIQATAYKGLSVTVNGQPAQLAVVIEGQVVAIGKAVAEEAEAVAVNNYRNFLKGEGHLTVMGKPILRAA
uniref:Uncharacterized protein n=1 Tax=biofilter metagenome TaxID=1070537 RepID=A0A1A7GDL2_9ZZZZ